jgi:hypothetical protein
MTFEEADRLVYAFVDLMSEDIGLILDAALLPVPKTRMKLAFAVWLEDKRTKLVGLTVLRDELVDKSWANDAIERCSKELNLAECLSVSLEDFVFIAPSDRNAVAALNAIPKGETWPEWAPPLFLKYGPGSTR